MTYAINRQTILHLLGHPVRIALCCTLLHPLLAQATEIPASDAAVTANISSKLVNMRDPRIAGMSIKELFPEKNDRQRNIVRYSQVPVAEPSAAFWSPPPSKLSPLATYIAVFAASLALNTNTVPLYLSNSEIVIPSRYGAYNDTDIKTGVRTAEQALPIR